MTQPAPPPVKKGPKLCGHATKDKYGNPTFCEEKVLKEEGRILPCKNKAHHTVKIKTGFCGVGHCEGTKPKNWRGDAMPTCTFWQTCGCDCHVTYDKMFSMSNMERQAVDNSGFVPDRGDFKPIEIIVRETPSPLSNAPITTDGPVYESPAPGVVPAVLARSFAPTPTGRAARGELEYDVKRAVDTFIIEEEDGYCTPVWIATEIGKFKGFAPPSTGAVTAVLERWVTYGFAELAKKPTRFVRYTDEGVAIGLEAMRDRFKRRTKMQQTAAKLGRRT
jgi:hypothetical protein